jgi:succinate dehydrogenase/fumarate reductase flavoprotein subunit
MVPNLQLIPCIKWRNHMTYDADVIIVGSGLAGLVAADGPPLNRSDDSRMRARPTARLFPQVAETDARRCSDGCP